MTAKAYYAAASEKVGRSVQLAMDLEIIRALGSEKRLLILHWLRDPASHFPAQTHGDLVEDGVCGLFIAEKLGVSQASAGEHLHVLRRAGLIRGIKIKQWVFYRRDERAVERAKDMLRKDW